MEQIRLLEQKNMDIDRFGRNTHLAGFQAVNLDVVDQVALLTGGSLRVCCGLGALRAWVAP